MSPKPASLSFSSSSRFIVALSVVIGFTILVVGGIAFLFGLNFLGETLVLTGVFVFAVSLICWVAARRSRNR